MSSAMSYVKGLFVTEPKTDDPKNWTNKQKYIVVAVIAYCAFVSPLASSIYMPAIVQVRDDLNTTSSMVSATLSVYVLILGIMPVFWASLCDYLGRRPIYIASMTIFIIGSLLAAISKNIWVFFFMRAIQAFGSSSVLSVGGGSLSDIFHSGERGSAFGLYYLGPLIAPMIGPILGGVLSDRAGWRSTMWLLFGAAVVALFLVIFILPETYRKHIDESPAPEKETGVDASHVSPSHIYSTHSTLVASKTSLHSTSSRRSAVGVPLSIPSDRMSIHSAHSAHTHHSAVNQTESAMEFIVPNFVPPYMMQDDEEEANNAEGSGNSSIMKADIQKTEIRHVAFPTEKQELEQNEKQTDAKSVVSVAVVQEAMTDGNNEDQDEIDESLKRKPFNPLRPLLCLRKPTNALLVTFNALALGSQFCMNNTLPISFTNNYNLSESIIGVCFCAGGFGSVTGSLIGGRYSDYVMRRWLIKQELKRQRDEKDRQAAFGENSTAVSEINIDLSMRAPPEVRLQSVWLGVVVLPIGLMLFGWSVQKNLPLPVPLVAIFLVGFGMMMVFSSTTTALVDANSDNNMATAAVACNSFARGVTGAIGGFTALPLEGAMGSGWLYTFWAFMTLIGAGGLVLMVTKAKSWRERAAARALDKV